MNELRNLIFNIKEGNLFPFFNRFTESYEALF